MEEVVRTQTLIEKNKYAKKRNEQGAWIVYLFLIAYLLVRALFSANDATTHKGIVIPFIQYNQFFILMAVLIGFVALVVIYRKCTLDLISFILLFRVFLCTVPVIYMPFSMAQVGNLIETVFPFLVYFILSNTNADIKNIAKILVFFGVFMALQCVLAYVMIVKNGYATYFDLWYKDYFAIPVGATNDIAAVMVPFLIFGNVYINKNSHKWIYSILLMLAIVLTKSRTGVILSVCFFAVRFFTFKSEKFSLIHRILVCFVFCSVAIIYMVATKSAILEKLITFFQGYSSGSGGLNSLFSGRFDLFAKYFNSFVEHPLFGNGVGYANMGMKSHNAILGVLYENGIIGLANLCVFLVLLVYYTVKAKDKGGFYKAFVFMLPFMFVNAMVEEILFNKSIILMGILFLVYTKKAVEHCAKNKEACNKG